MDRLESAPVGYDRETAAASIGFAAVGENTTILSNSATTTVKHPVNFDRVQSFSIDQQSDFG